ncbi:Endoglycosylceramidase OS=Streptomyces violarus OX=67380 GN=FHS41_000354 PE=4 SV=1 [Streptomyces violarus]
MLRKIRTGDAWNDEDLSAVRLDDRGLPQLRQDARLLDRLYPSAVAGRTLAFLYEDRSRDAGKTLTWSQVPAGMPALAQLTGWCFRYGLLVWAGRRVGRADGPGTSAGRLRSRHDHGRLGPRYGDRAGGLGSDHAIAPEPGGTAARRILLSGTSEGSATVHFALVSAAPATAEQRTAVRAELGRWVAAGFAAG